MSDVAPIVPADFDVPLTLDGPGFRLEQLTVAHNVEDFAAWHGSQAHIHATPGFAGRDWPTEDYTLEQNEGDLAEHEQDFAKRIGFTYTVLDPATCRGDRLRLPLPAQARGLRPRRPVVGARRPCRARQAVVRRGCWRGSLPTGRSARWTTRRGRSAVQITDMLPTLVAVRSGASADSSSAYERVDLQVLEPDPDLALHGSSGRPRPWPGARRRPPSATARSRQSRWSLLPSVMDTPYAAGAGEGQDPGVPLVPAPEPIDVADGEGGLWAVGHGRRLPERGRNRSVAAITAGSKSGPRAVAAGDDLQLGVRPGLEPAARRCPAASPCPGGRG